MGINFKNGIDQLERAFKSKRVFITGQTGFKGSWLAIWLRELGADILGYSLDPPSNPNNFEATRLSNKIINIRGDIRDFSYLKKIFVEFMPEFVFHLAAQPLVRYSYEEPHTTFETNVMGTVNVCELVRTTESVRSFVNVTSDKCYENKEWIWGYRENDPLGGNDPYSTSKACADLVSQAYIKSFFCEREDIGAASARAGNVIGGGDWGTDRLVPDCIRAISRSEDILIRNPKAIRPWQHLLEPLSGYILLASKLYDDPKGYTGSWNFGPDNTSCITVKEIVEKVLKCWGTGSWKDVSISPDDGKHEMSMLKLNCDKAYSFLQWKSILDIDKAIVMTINWYKEFYHSTNNDMYEYCSNQIREYVSLLST